MPRGENASYGITCTNRRTYLAALLSSWGLLAGVTGVVLHDPTNYAPASLAGGLRWLAVLVSVILGGGLVLSGVRVRQGGLEYARRMRLPALVLVAVGAVFAVGSVPVLRPWEFAGLPRGLLTWGVVVFFAVGGFCVAAGLWCYQRRQPRLPLLLPAVITGVETLYPLVDTRLLVGANTPVYVAFVLVFIGVLALGLFSVWHTFLAPEPVAESGGT
jgi:hypothetical protein